jgi:L-threonine-O-3-phosphate decarboxylase
MELKTHGGNVYDYITKNNQQPIDFSANINPFGLPKGVKKKLIESIDEFTLYPDVTCSDLRKALSQHENMKEDDIVFGNGAADLIFRLVYGIKPQKALLLAPTFSEYELALSNVDCEIDYYNLKPQNNFRVEADLLEQIKDKDIVFICNPNNPTGMVMDQAFMLRIIKTCKMHHCYLVIDECFNDFIENKEAYSCKTFMNDYDNLIILKAFTKLYAMAGLRLGYLFSSNKALRDTLLGVCQPWSVSVPAQIAGIEALKETAYVEKTIQHNESERKYLVKALKALGLHVFEGYANYILFELEKPFDLYTALYNKGILIRKCENYRGLGKGYYRIAIKGSEDNRTLIKSLQEILGGDING